jgi:hypothetical protein
MADSQNITPDTKGLAKLFHKMSDLEFDTGTISDLAETIMFLNRESSDDETSGLVLRLALIIAEHATKIEDARAEAFHTLHAYAYPRPKTTAEV